MIIGAGLYTYMQHLIVSMINIVHYYYAAKLPETKKVRTETIQKNNKLYASM